MMEGRDARAILANEVYSRVDVFRDAVSSRAVEIADIERLQTARCCNEGSILQACKQCPKHFIHDPIAACCVLAESLLQM